MEATGSCDRRRPRHFCRSIEAAPKGDTSCPVPSHRPAVEVFSVTVCACVTKWLLMDILYLFDSFLHFCGSLKQHCACHNFVGARELEIQIQSVTDQTEQECSSI